MAKNNGGMPSVYAESSALLAVLVPGDLHHRDAVEMFDKIRGRGYRIIVSSLTLMETFGSIRKKFATSIKCRSGSEGERAGVDAHVRNAVKDAFGLLDEMVNQGIIEIIEPEDWSPDLFLLYTKVLEHAGYVLHVKKGRPFRRLALN